MERYVKHLLLQPLTIIVVSSLLLASASADHGGFFWDWLDFYDEIQLTAGPDAPAGAEGWAALISWDDNSNNILVLHTWGLAAGTYTVTITETTSVTSVELGTLTSVAHSHRGVQYEHGHAWFELPSGVTTADVSSVTITDSTDTVVFSGDFTLVVTPDTDD